MINAQKLNKAEKKELAEEVKLAANNLKLYWQNYRSHRTNRLEVAQWYGRYVALARLFEINEIPENELTMIYSQVFLN